MTDSASIQFIYFDLDDTLLDHRHAERAALGDVIEHFPDLFTGHPLDAVHTTYHEINAPLWKAYASGEIEKSFLKASRFRRLLQVLGSDATRSAAVNQYYLARYADHWRYVPGAHAAYTHLADAYRVGILTNGFAEIQSQKMKQFPTLQERASSVVISEETGHLKPHPAVFTYAANQAGVAPESVLYVGDSYRSDVQGTARAGWRVAWYVRGDTDAHPVPHGFTFSSWDALCTRLAP